MRGPAGPIENQRDETAGNNKEQVNGEWKEADHHACDFVYQPTAARGYREKAVKRDHDDNCAAAQLIHRGITWNRGPARSIASLRSADHPAALKPRSVLLNP